MSTLYGRAPGQTYVELLKINHNGSGLDATLRTVEDGDGTGSPLTLASNKIAFHGQIWPTSGAAEGKILVLGASNQMSWINLDTDSITEGSNLFYTDARVRSAISVTGSLTYNATTGVLGFTETPLTSENIVSALGYSPISQAQLASNLSGSVTTLDPNYKGATTTLTGGNLIATIPSGSVSGARSTRGVSSGKVYWEVTQVSGAYSMLGIVKSTVAATDIFFTNTNSWFYYSGNGRAYNGSSNFGYGPSFTTGDVIGFALDMDAGTLSVYKNNTFLGVMVSGLSGTVHPAVSAGDASAVGAQFVFSATSFQYSPPAGFNALSVDPLSVISLNGRTGEVTLASSDVTTALGYTPANSASTGDFKSDGTVSMTGGLTTPSVTSTNSVAYGGSALIDSSTITTTSTAQTTVIGYNAIQIRGGKFTVTMTQGTNVHITELLVVHNGTNAYITEYGTVLSGSSLGEFDVVMESGEFVLKVTPSSAISTVLRWSATLLRV